VKVFTDFGLASINITPADFTKPEQIIQIGYPPFRIDILTSVDGVEFNEAYPNRNIIEIDGLPVTFIGLEELKKNKQASGRGRDLDDLQNLDEN